MSGSAIDRDPFLPAFGVWVIFKHRKTGALLGPCAARHVPTRAVLAAIDGDKWRELTPEEAMAYSEALVSTIH